jgi:TetR/AcrR family transcriptional regulator, mexJK operon transcriptional repressor
MRLDEQTLKTPPPARRIGPGPGRPRREDVEQRNQELLDKALDLFLEKGFERTTIADITAAVGMHKRTVYARYGDKTTLFKEALQRAIAAWLVPVEQMRAVETGDLEESLLRLTRLLVDRMLDPSGLRLLRITNIEVYRMPEICLEAQERGGKHITDHVADLIRRHLTAEQAAMVDLDKAATAYLIAVAGGPARMGAWGLTLDATELDRVIRNRVHIFVRGLLPR